MDEHSLKLQFTSAELLGQPIASGNREPVRPVITSSQASGLLVSFSYLDPGDAIGLTIYTNQTNLATTVEVEVGAYIKGMPQGVRKRKLEEIASKREIIWIFLSLPLAAIMLYLFWGLFLLTGAKLGFWNLVLVGLGDPDKGPSSFLWLLVFLFASLLLVGVIFFGIFTLLNTFGRVPYFVRQNVR